MGRSQSAPGWSRCGRHDPHQLGPIAAFGPNALVAHDKKVAVEERDHRVGKAVIGRMIVPARHHLGPCLVGDVENDEPAVDIAEIGAVRALGIDIGVVRAKAGVGAFRIASRRRLAVARPRAGQPPAADFDVVWWGS